MTAASRTSFPDKDRKEQEEAFAGPRLAGVSLLRRATAGRLLSIITTTADFMMEGEAVASRGDSGPRLPILQLYRDGCRANIPL